MDDIDLVFATDSVRLTDGAGGPVLVGKGTHWPADDPIVLANPGLFSSDPRWGLFYTREPVGYHDEGRSEAPVEQATRAPGERRPTRRS